MDDHSDDGRLATPAPERAREAPDRITAALRGLRFGTVTAVVQDGIVVQVERTEKVRLSSHRSPTAASAWRCTGSGRVGAVLPTRHEEAGREATSRTRAADRTGRRRG